MAKLIRFSATVDFSQVATRVQTVETGYDPKYVDSEYDGLFRCVTYVDGTQETTRHKKLCPW